MPVGRQHTPKQHFEALQNFIKEEKSEPELCSPDIKSQGHWLRVAWCGLTPSPWTTENRFKCLMLKSTAIKIMEESGIFYEGGLKGADYPGGDLRYESHPIKDLDQFIYDLAWYFYIYEQNISGYTPELQAYLFSEIMRYLKLLKSDVERFKGKREARRVETLLGKLDKLKTELEAKPVISSDVSKPQIKRQVADIFLKHIQAPNTKETMAARSADLLNVFNISATQEGMREYFKNK